MNSPLIIFSQCLLLTAIFSSSACNNANDPLKPEDQALKDKVDTIKKSEAADQLIQETAENQRRTIDEQGQ